MPDTAPHNETALAAVDGNERWHCVDDPTGTPVDRYLTPDALGPFRQIPFFEEANNYLTTPFASAASAGTISADRLHMCPIWVPYRRTFTTLAVVVTTGGAGLARIGLYNSHQQSGHPTTLIQEATSTLDVSTTGIKTGTISQALNPGMYYLAYTANIAHSVMRLSGVHFSCMGVLFSASNTLTNNGLYRSRTYAALSADETASTFATIVSLGSANPVLGIR